jgi:hypothetical protein
MTSIAAYIPQAQGAYRTPDETGFTYMILDSVRWAEQSQPPTSRRRQSLCDGTHPVGRPGAPCGAE